MSDSNRSTPFGFFLRTKMAEARPPLTQSELHRQSGVSQATLSRWLNGDGRPDSENLKKVAAVLGVSHDELLTIAGYGTAAADVHEQINALRPDIDPIAGELSAMLSASSLLTDDDRAFLRHMIDRLIDPYRRQMRPSRGNQ